MSPAKLDYAGQYLAKQPWARRDSQLWRLLTGEICSATGNDQLDLESLKSVIRNVYRLVVSDMAPKLQGLMNEVRGNKGGIRNKEDFFEVPNSMIVVPLTTLLFVSGLCLHRL